MLLRDVMKQSGLSKKAVQYYEEQGFIHPDKLENGYVDYDKDCLETLCTIRSLRQMGLRMKEIRAILIDQEYAPQVYEQLIHEMDAQIVRLQDQRAMLRKHMKQEPAEILPAAVNRPYVYIRRPRLLLGSIQLVVTGMGFLLFLWLPVLHDKWLLALLAVFILQIIENIYYDTRVHGLQYMEISWMQLLFTAGVSFLCGLLLALALREGLARDSIQLLLLTAFMTLLLLWNGFHLYSDERLRHTADSENEESSKSM